MKLSAYRRQRRGGRGVIGAATRESDFTEHLAVASTHDTLLFFTGLGRVFWQRVFELPLMGRTASGRAVASVLKLKDDERITSMLAVSDFGSGTLAMATQRGRIKRTKLGEFSNPRPSGLVAVKLEEGDRLVGVERVDDEDELVLATARGKAVRFSASQVRPMGRASAGVSGVKLKGEDRVVALVRAEPLLGLVTISANGFAKRTPVGEYRLMRRGGQGVTNMSVSPRTGDVVACLAAAEEDEILVMTAGGLVVRTNVAEFREMGRSVQGVRVMRIAKDDRVIAAVRLEAQEEEESGAEAEDDEDEELEEEIAPDDADADADEGDADEEDAGEEDAGEETNGEEREE
jgi:DNA gyrase subunit A